MSGKTVAWPAYTESQGTDLDFNLNMSASNIKSDMLPQANQFWNVLLPCLIKDSHNLEKETNDREEF